MGMPISVDIRGNVQPPIFDSIYTLLIHIEAQFSTYKSTSEVTQYAGGNMTIDAMGPDGLAVFAECMQWDERTEGFFSPFFNGTYDPTGYVKGWAIQRVADLLQRCGIANYCINAGGDVLAHSLDGVPWSIALQHPRNPSAAIGVLRAQNMAVATSGTYARGNHIIDPYTADPATEILSVTVRGPAIITADVLATTVCAMGVQRGLKHMTRYPQYEAFCILPDLSVRSTAHFT